MFLLASIFLFQLNAETIERAADFVACEALTCDFNHNHSCFYKLSGFGSTLVSVSRKFIAMT